MLGLGLILWLELEIQMDRRIRVVGRNQDLEEAIKGRNNSQIHKHLTLRVRIHLSEITLLQTDFLLNTLIQFHKITVM
jgi:hypothetical protein